jgi:hypothetical protein
VAIKFQRKSLLQKSYPDLWDKIQARKGRSDYVSYLRGIRAASKTQEERDELSAMIWEAMK